MKIISFLLIVTICMLSQACTTMIDPVTGESRQMMDPATATGIAVATGVAAGVAGYAIGNNNNNNNYYNNGYYNPYPRRYYRW